MVPVNKGLHKCKTKHSNRFRDNQAYSGISQAYSGIFRTQCNPGIFRTGTSKTLTYSKPEIYSEPWYIQNPDIFRTLVYSKSEASTMKRFVKIVNCYYYFQKL